MLTSSHFVKIIIRTALFFYFFFYFSTLNRFKGRQIFSVHQSKQWKKGRDGNRSVFMLIDIVMHIEITIVGWKGG